MSSQLVTIALAICEVRICLRQRQQFINSPDALATTRPTRKMPSQCVNSHGALLDQQFAALVQHQHGLIIGTFDRHKAHVRARHRLADRCRINRIVLAALDIGLDVSRRYQHHLVPHRDKFAAQ